MALASRCRMRYRRRGGDSARHWPRRGFRTHGVDGPPRSDPRAVPADGHPDTATSAALAKQSRAPEGRREWPSHRAPEGAPGIRGRGLDWAAEVEAAPQAARRWAPVAVR